MILTDNKYVSSMLDKDTPAIISQFNKPIVGQTFRNILSESLDIYIQYKKDFAQLSLMIDFGKMSAFKPEDQVWMQNEWNTRIKKAGLAHLAVIMPDSIFGQLGIKRYLKKETDFIVQLFEKTMDARSWLQDMKQLQI